MPQALRALQGQEAPQGLKEKEVPPVSVEPLEVPEEQGQQGPWAHKDLRVPGDPQDRRGTEVLLGKEEQRERVGFQTSLL